MRRSFFVLSIILSILILSGCTYRQKYDDENFFGKICWEGVSKAGLEKKKQKIESTRRLLKKLGLGGDVNLIELTRDRSIRGNFRGGLLTGTSGEIQSYSSVLFRWKCADNRSFYGELPLTKVAIKNTKGSPKLHIIFKVDESYKGYKIDCLWRKDFTILRRRPNDVTNPDYIFQATIKISEEDVEKYLAFK